MGIYSHGLQRADTEAANKPGNLFNKDIQNKKQG